MIGCLILANISDGLWTGLGHALLALLTAGILYIANAVRLLLNRRLAKPVHVEETAWRDNRIHDALTHLRFQLDADRTYFSRFHNGDHFIDNCEMLKKTRTHESVRDGLTYQGELYKGMIVSTMNDEVDLVREDGPSFKLVKDLPTGKFKWLCQQGGVVSIVRCAVRKGGKIVGFVGADMKTEEKPVGIDAVCECAARIEQLV